MRSSTAANGPEARPCASRINARRIVSSGKPNRREIKHITALSCARMPAALPALWFCKKISASEPSA